MVFLVPRHCHRNTARYTVQASTPDFLLQVHRVTLRKHVYLWRVVTAHKTHNGNRWKVAKSETLSEISQREWRYITEELPQKLPRWVQQLPASDPDRVAWILDHIAALAQQLGDVELSSDEEDNASAVPESPLPDPPSPHERMHSYSQDAEAEPEAESESLSPVRQRRAGYRARHQRSLSDGMLDSALLASAGEASPAASDSLAPARKRPTLAVAAATNGVAQAPSAKPGVSKSLRKRVLRTSASASIEAPPPSSGTTSEVTNSSASTLGSWFTAPFRGASPGSPSNAKRAGSTTAATTPAATPAPAAASRLGFTRSARALLGSSASSSASLSHAGSRSARALMGKDSSLPSYLTAGGDATSAHEGPVTMAELKREHELRIILMAVPAVTLGAFVLRFVSFDAFLILLALLDAATVMAVKKRHTLVKRFATSSVKRRVKFGKIWFSSRFGGSAPGGGAQSLAGTSSAQMGDAPREQSAEAPHAD